jgi:predicted RNase H-like HicB family nuclease
MTTTTFVPKYATTVFPDRLTNGRACWVAQHPGLDGVHGEGGTKIDAQLDLEAAREAYFAVLRQTGKPVPYLAPSDSLVVREVARPVTGSSPIIVSAPAGKVTTRTE